VAVEFGAGQESLVEAIFEATGAYTEVELAKDLADRPRVAVARRG
jgi:methylase of polypeptide subunit release factors